MGVIILAGGKSSRMGRDKAAIELNGRRLIDIALEAARSYADSVVVVGGAPTLPESIPDLFPGEGPLGGLITGLRHLGPGVHLAFACDMPFMNRSVFQMIESMIIDYDAAVPSIEGQMYPLCAAYRGGAADPLKAAFDSGERRLVGALDRIRCRRIPVAALRVIDPDLRFLFNINTPEDLERAKELSPANE